MVGSLLNVSAHKSAKDLFSLCVPPMSPPACSVPDSVVVYTPISHGQVVNELHVS